MGAAFPFVKAALATFFTSSLVGYVVARTVLINLALGAITKKLSRRRETVPPLNVTIHGTVEKRRIVLGTRRVGGVIVFYVTSGVANTTLWYVVVYAGHQVSAITDVWLDTVKIANADINGGAAGGGAVAGSGQFAGKVSIYKFLGTSAQTVQTDLDTASSEWTSNHRLRGCAYVVVKMERSDSAFPSGAPQSVSVLMDGALMYDPRLDSTNGGTGSHRSANPSTWAFAGGLGRNPALQARWFISGGSVVNDQATRQVMYGLREIDSRILDAYTITAANECDESISGANAPPSGTQLRYRSDIEASCGEARREILEAILATMAGTAVNEHGQWRIHAGAYDTPTHTLTQADLYGELQIQDTTPHDSRYNAVGATFVDSAKQYVEQTTIFRTDSAYETQDGGERIPRVLDLRAVTDQYQAQRLCEIELRKSRMMRTVQLVGALNLLKVAKHETLTFSHARYGWSSRIFRCMARQFEFNEEAGRVVITAQREDPAVYTDLLTADYTTGTSATDVFVLDGPDAPTDLTIARFPEQLLLVWTLPTFRSATLWTEIWEHTAQTPFASATKIHETQANFALIKNYSPTEPRYYWIRFRNASGQFSATFPATNGQPGQPLNGLEEAFFDTFEHQDYARFYDVAASPTITFPADGTIGGRVIQVEDEGILQWKQNIAYDPNALYLITVVARLITAPSNPANDLFYCGLAGYEADGTTTTGSLAVAASAFDFGSVSLNAWQTFRGYVTGLAASPSPQPAPDIAAPCEMVTDTTFFRPFISFNRVGGDGVMQVDYLRIDRVVGTEDIGPNAATEIYTSRAKVGGSVSVTSLSSDPSAFNGETRTSVLNYTPSVTCQASVTWSAIVRLTSVSGGTPEFYYQISCFDGSTNQQEYGDVVGVVSQTLEVQFAALAVFDLEAGVEYDFTTKWAKAFGLSGQGVNINSEVLRVEILKK